MLGEILPLVTLRRRYNSMSMRLSNGSIGIKDPVSKEFIDIPVLTPRTDIDLTQTGIAADSKAVGDALQVLKDSIAVERGRIDALSATTVPSTETELAGIRVGYDGAQYSDAGNAVRDQILTLLDRIKTLENENMELRLFISQFAIIGYGLQDRIV